MSGKREWLIPFFKVLVTVVILLLLLLIPLFMIRNLVTDRRALKTEAAERIIEEIGGELILVGPVLVLPYELEQIELRDGEETILKQRSEIYLLPDSFTLKGRLEVKYRSLGIYRVPVYRAFVDGSGTVHTPLSGLYPADAIPVPEENRFTIGITHMEGIRGISELRWGSQQIDFLADSGDVAVGNGVSATVGEITASENADGGTVDFSFDMEISGGGRADFVPLGRSSALELSGDWPSPSFLGGLLPSEMELDDKGFNANWRIPEVSRPIRPYWDSSEGERIDSDDHGLGVKLLESVASYKKTERSVKYGLLFLLIPFVVFFLFETLARLRVHPLQYLMVGAANVIFYLLLLSISEHLGFDMAYVIAALGVTALISIYTHSVIGGGHGEEREENGRRSSALAMYLTMPITLAVSYLWLWFTLRSEDYALLLGSVGVFVVLGSVMLITRKIKWYHH